jgi:hypothetical protein
MANVSVYYSLEQESADKSVLNIIAKFKHSITRQVDCGNIWLSQGCVHHFLCNYSLKDNYIQIFLANKT